MFNVPPFAGITYPTPFFAGRRTPPSRGDAPDLVRRANEHSFPDGQWSRGLYTRQQLATGGLTGDPDRPADQLNQHHEFNGSVT